MKRKKLLFISFAQGRGGAEEYVIHILRAATKENWACQAAVPFKDAHQGYLADLKTICTDVKPLEVFHDNWLWECRKERVGLLNYFQKSKSLIKNVNPDHIFIVLQWPTYHFGAMLAAAYLHIPATVVFQLVPHQILQADKTKRLYNWVIGKNQRFLAVSRENRELISSMFSLPDSEIDVIYNGVEIKSSHPDRETSREAIVEEFSLSPQSRIVLSAGRIAEQKGYNHLIEAVNLIRGKIPEEVVFLIAGEGPLQEQYQKRINELGLERKIIFAGQRNDMPEMFAAADLFAFPSIYEGHPFALMEAMEAGLPAVSTDASGIPELITHRLEGLIAEKDNSESFSEVLLFALENPGKMKVMAAKALQKILMFSQETMIEQTLEIMGRSLIK